MAIIFAQMRNSPNKNRRIWNRETEKLVMVKVERESARLPLEQTRIFPKLGGTMWVKKVTGYLAGL